MNIIKQLRKGKNLSQDKLANILNVHQTAVSQWEQGRTMPDLEVLKQLSNYFGVSIDYILGNETEKPISKGIKIPVLGKVIAGIPIEAVEEILDYEEITQDMASHGEHFALQVKGDSMEPQMFDGDIIIVRKQSDVDNGSIAVVLVNGNEATIKKIKKQSDGIMLIPSNPNFDVMFYNNHQIQQLPVSIIGKAVEIRRKLS